MSLRGGSDGQDVIEVLRDLLSRREGSGPSLQDLVMEAMQKLKPTTRLLLLLNVLLYVMARIGLLGKDPAETYGISSERIVLRPKMEGYRLLTGIFLHLNHAHLVSNMLALAALGNKVEDRIGSSKFALLISVLIPSVGLVHVSTNILFNALGSLLGFRDTRQEHLRSFSQHVGIRAVIQRIVMHQISMRTISIGFSGILFALNAIGTEMFSGGSLFCVPLNDLPHDIRLYVTFVRTWEVHREAMGIAKTLCSSELGAIPSTFLLAEHFDVMFVLFRLEILLFCEDQSSKKQEFEMFLSRWSSPNSLILCEFLSADT
eukprot:80829-Hanusia_phi.AAC.2